MSGNAQPTVEYDPVARVVTLNTSSATGSTPWLTPGQVYTVTIPVPNPGEMNSGPRAIDGATLTAPYKLEFIAGPPDPAAGPSDGDVHFCEDVLPIFQLRCSGSSCHAAPVLTKLPAEGLILETPDGVTNTALGRASQEANTGARAGAGLPAGKAFGVDMPILDPHNPGNSWLMYKLLLSRQRPVDQGADAGVAICGKDGGAPTPGLTSAIPFAVPLSDDERARLGDHMLGRSMPYPEALGEDEPTPDPAGLPCTFEEMERIRAWIAKGAQTTACLLCP
jgi:hypothetical protein